MPRCGLPGQLFCKPRRLLRCPFCLGLVQFLPGLSQLFPGGSAFACAFWYLSFLLPAFSAEPSGSCALPVSCGPPLHLLPHAVRGTAFPAVLLKLAAFGLRAIVARRAVLPVSRPQTAGVGMVRGRPFPFSRSGAIAPVSSVGPGL